MANQYSMVKVQKARSLFANGKSVQQISKMKYMPSVKTLSLWIVQKHGGEWLVPVRQIRAIVDPQELEQGIQSYFVLQYVRVGRWKEVGVQNEEGIVINYEKQWVAELDASGEQLMKLRKPLSWAALAGYLEVSASTLTKYRDGFYDTDECKYSEILEMAEDRIKEFNVDALYSKETVNGAKFILGRARAFKKEFKQGDDDDKNKGKRKLEDFFNNKQD